MALYANAEVLEEEYRTKALWPRDIALLVAIGSVCGGAHEEPELEIFLEFFWSQ
jgi:hypothetical protein